MAEEFKFYPQNTVWEITFACNMRCLHCGTAAGRIRPEELTSDEALALIDELAELGCQLLTLSGGEPLLRKDWRELARRSKQNGIKTFLISNGYIVDQKIVDDFKEIGFDNVGISFDGTEPTHNYIRQRPDSYKNAFNAMKLLSANDVRFCSVTQVSNINLGELDQIRELLIDAGCKLWRIQMTTDTGRMSRDLVLTLDNYPKLIDKLLEFKKMDEAITIDVGENIGYYGCKGTGLYDGMPYLGCYAGTRVLGIESDGKVKGCLSMPEEFVEGNIRDSSLTEIWNNPDGFAYNRKFTRETASGACYHCHYLPLCRGGCTTTSISATGERANNPFCMYQIEKKMGIVPEDSEQIKELLNRFDPIEEEVPTQTEP
jgi:radical SAM protein with 4Fe4S-binding SPASM domain